MAVNDLGRLEVRVEHGRWWARRTWGRANVTAERRSACLLTGPARAECEHGIPRADALRYSITFRNLREG